MPSLPNMAIGGSIVPEFNRAAYWERRYQSGGTSGPGSQGQEARYKAQLVTDAVRDYGIQSILDLGSGDGVVAAMLPAALDYVGFDPAPTAVSRAQLAAPDRRFTASIPPQPFDATLSMDVLFHLVADDDYKKYLDLVFCRPLRFAMVYGTCEDRRGAPHVRHRDWLRDVPPTFQLLASQASDTFKDWWLFGRVRHD